MKFQRIGNRIRVISPDGRTLRVVHLEAKHWAGLFWQGGGEMPDGIEELVGFGLVNEDYVNACDELDRLVDDVRSCAAAGTPETPEIAEGVLIAARHDFLDGDPTRYL